jgi:hypothetical protein
MSLRSTKQRLIQPTLLTGSLILLSGCIETRNTTQETTQVPAQEQTQGEREAERLMQCQKELEALKDINHKQYIAYKQEFEQLMSGAAQYAALRLRVNSGTQETVDALYRYKVSRLCANITQAALTGLTERGERLK